MKPRPFHFFLFLLATGFLLYLPVINTGFFADDFYVLNRLQNGVFSAGNLFRPLSDVSIYLDHLLWGNRAIGFHITSILLHIITSFLVYRVFTATMRYWQVTVPNWLAPVAGILFLLYPFHNETVVWIVGRGIILATLFCIASLYLYLVANGRKKYHWLAWMFYFVALFGYESVVLFPCILLVFEIVAAKGKWKMSMLKKTLPFWLVLLLYLCIRMYFIGGLIGASDYFRVEFLPLTLLLNLFRLVERSFIFPLENYAWGIILSVMVFIVAVIALKKAANRQAVLMVINWGLLYLLAVLPAITIGISTHTTEGERFLYFPSVFLVSGLVMYIHAVATTTPARNAFLFFVILYFGVFLFISNSNWRKSSAIVSAITANAGKYDCTGTLFIIDMPDNINGALTLRNGFGESFAVLNKTAVGREIKILSRKALDDRLLPTTIERASDDLVMAGRFSIKKAPGGFAPGWMIFDLFANAPPTTVLPGDKIFYFDGVTLQQLPL